MRPSTFLLLFAFYLLSCSYAQDAPPPPEAKTFRDSSQILKRIVRQMPNMPSPPTPPNIPQWPNNDLRMKRDAKGVGGYMPTRKG